MKREFPGEGLWREREDEGGNSWSKMTWVACAKTEQRKCIVHQQELETAVSEGDASEEKKTAVNHVSWRQFITFRLGDVSGSPVVEALPSNAGGAGSTPGWGINMPHASRPKKPLRKKNNKNKVKEDKIQTRSGSSRKPGYQGLLSRKMTQQHMLLLFSC